MSGSSISVKDSVQVVMRAKYDAMKIYWYTSLVLLATAAILGFWTFTYGTQSYFWSVTIPIVLVVGHFISRIKQGWAQDIAERARRLLFRADSFASPVSSRLMSDLELEHDFLSRKFARTNEEKYLTEYFGSDARAGEERFIENLRETIFFTAQLYRRASYILGTALVAIFLIATIWWLNAAILPVSDRWIWLSRSFGFVIVFLFSADLVSLWFNYRKTAFGASAIEKRIAILSEQGQLGEDTLPDMVTEYDCLRIVARPIPTKLYETMRDELNAAWKRRIGQNG